MKMSTLIFNVGKVEQNRTEHNRTEYNRTEQNRKKIKQNKRNTQVIYSKEQPLTLVDSIVTHTHTK